MVPSSPDAPDNEHNPDRALPDFLSGRENGLIGHQAPMDDARPLRTTTQGSTKKRKRILHACDECRLKKIKCDGKKPCVHCAVYHYECTYNEPSKRGHNKSPRQIETLEERLQKTESLLRILEPGLDINNLYRHTNSPEQIARALRGEYPGSSLAGRDTPPADGAETSLLGTMMENFGSFDLDDKGRWNYNGHSSTTIFIQRLQNQFGNLISPAPAASKPGLIAQNLGESRPDIEASRMANRHNNASFTSGLPLEAEAIALCRASFDEACILNHFVHEPSFWSSFDRIYGTSWDQYGAGERTFLPLLYAVMAVGCLFSDTDKSTSSASDESIFKKGFEYFGTCRELIDLTDLRNLTTLQAAVFMILFLQSSTQLSACYPYIGIVQRAALRLGLHRNIQGNFNPIECELRKRIFWVVRSMDILVSTRLGLPISVHSDDIDQEYAMDIDDEFITPVGILPMPPGHMPLMAGANAYNRLLDIMKQVVKNIYPVKLAKYQEKSDHTYMISYARIEEIERNLHLWTVRLPPALKMEGETTPQLPALERMKQMLWLAHAHVQWIMYRPFLHFASKGFQAESMDRPSYLCAAACVRASKRIIQIVKGMHQKALINGSYWFPMHAAYFATLTLIYLIVENRGQSTAEPAVLGDAFEGKDILEALASNRLAAERCPRLQSLFTHLRKKIHNSRDTSGMMHVQGDSEQLQAQPDNNLVMNEAQGNDSAALILKSPNVSIFDPAFDKPSAPQVVASSQWHDVRHSSSGLMSMFLPSESNTVQMDNDDFTELAQGEAAFFDDMFTHFDIANE